MKRHEVPAHMFLRTCLANYGYDHPQHAYLMCLYALTHWVKPQVAVEIGSRRGASAMWIAKAMAEGHEGWAGGKLYCIEPFCSNFGGGPEQSVEFARNIKTLGLEERVHVIQKKSAEASRDVPESLDLLYLDGDLSRDGLLHDLEEYATRVRVGGGLAIHDLRSEPAVVPTMAERDDLLSRFMAFILDDSLGLWMGIRVL